MGMLADLIEAHRDELVGAWIGRVREHLERDVSHAQLAGSVAQFLQELVKALRRGTFDVRGHSERAIIDIAETLGRQRFRLGYEINAVVWEYGILREVIFDLAERSGKELSVPELRVLTRAITSGIAEALAYFSERQEKALRASESKLAAILEHLPSSIYLKDLQGRYLFGNQAFARLTTEAEGAVVRELGLDDATQTLAADDLAVIQSGRSLEVEEVVPTGAGPRIYRSIKFPLHDESGAPYALCGISFDTTERKQQEAALLHSAELLELGDALLVVDREWNITHVNRNEERLAQQSRDQLLGRLLWDVWPSARAPRYYEEYRRCMNERVPVSFEEYYPPLDVWTAVTAYPTQDGGMAMFSRDVSSRRRTEEELERQRTLNESLLRAQSDLGQGFAVVEGDRIQYANEALARLTGYSQAELTALERHVSLIVPEEREAFEVRRRAREPGSAAPETQTLSLLRKDGRRISLEVSSIGLGDGRRIVLSRDVSEQAAYLDRLNFLAQASELLASSLDYPVTLKRFARLVVDRMADYCIIDILGATGLLERLHVEARDPELESLVRESMPYPAQAGSESPVLRAFETGSPQLVPTIDAAWLDRAAQSSEHRALLERLTPKSAMLLPLVSRGRHFGIVNIVSRGRPFDQRDLQLAEELARRASVAIDNALLYGEAQEAANLREEVVAIVSHDLRNPLGAIAMSASNLLKAGTLSEAHTKVVERIASATRRATGLIKDLLDLAQARVRGSIPVERSACNFHEMARAIVDEVRSAHPQRLIEFRAEGSGDGEFDWNRLAQVVTNLVGNAVEHGQPEEAVRVSSKTTDGHHVFAVHNGGAPIPASTIPGLFEPFRRGSQRPGGGGGVGLGLYITDQIVRAHGGSIAVRSTAREGTTFEVTLPRTLPELREYQVAGAPGQGAREPPRRETW